MSADRQTGLRRDNGAGPTSNHLSRPCAGDVSPGGIHALRRSVQWQTGQRDLRPNVARAEMRGTNDVTSLLSDLLDELRRYWGRRHRRRKPHGGRSGRRRERLLARLRKCRQRLHKRDQRLFDRHKPKRLLFVGAVVVPQRRTGFIAVLVRTMIPRAFRALTTMPRGQRTRALVRCLAGEP